jgi:histidinol-phosphate aminotransferase
MIDRVSAYDNLVVIRTFSKALGLASARLGYLASTTEIVSHLFRTRPMYEVNAFAVSLGIYILTHPEIVAEYVDEVKRARKFLTEELPKDGFSIIPGFANFVLINVGGKKKAAQIVNGLFNEKVVIKGGFGEACMESYIRIGLGTLEQMENFLYKFRKVLADIA